LFPRTMRITKRFENYLLTQKKIKPPGECHPTIPTYRLAMETLHEQRLLLVLEIRHQSWVPEVPRLSPLDVGQAEVSRQEMTFSGKQVHKTI